MPDEPKPKTKMSDIVEGGPEEEKHESPPLSDDKSGPEGTSSKASKWYDGITEEQWGNMQKLAQYGLQKLTEDQSNTQHQERESHTSEASMDDNLYANDPDFQKAVSSYVEKRYGPEITNRDQATLEMYLGQYRSKTGYNVNKGWGKVFETVVKQNAKTPDKLLVPGMLDNLYKYSIGEALSSGETDGLNLPPAPRPKGSNPNITVDEDEQIILKSREMDIDVIELARIRNIMNSARIEAGKDPMSLADYAKRIGKTQTYEDLTQPETGSAGLRRRTNE
jgi:hypothetical protein